MVVAAVVEMVMVVEGEGWAKYCFPFTLMGPRGVELAGNANPLKATSHPRHHLDINIHTSTPNGNGFKICITDLR